MADSGDVFGLLKNEGLPILELIEHHLRRLAPGIEMKATQEYAPPSARS